MFYVIVTSIYEIRKRISLKDNKFEKWLLSGIKTIKRNQKTLLALIETEMKRIQSKQFKSFIDSLEFYEEDK